MRPEEIVLMILRIVLFVIAGRLGWEIPKWYKEWKDKKENDYD